MKYLLANESLLVLLRKKIKMRIMALSTWSWNHRQLELSMNAKT